MIDKEKTSTCAVSDEHESNFESNAVLSLRAAVHLEEKDEF